MTKNKSIFFSHTFCFGFILLFLFVFSDAAKVVPGGYKRVDINGKDIVAASKFAEMELAKKTETKGAKLVDVASAYSQVVAGTNYKLVLDLMVAKKLVYYEVVVFKSLKGKWNLTSSMKATKKACPKCTKPSLVPKDTKNCYGGPSNCNCCINTGEKY